MVQGFVWVPLGRIQIFFVIVLHSLNKVVFVLGGHCLSFGRNVICTVCLHRKVFPRQIAEGQTFINVNLKRYIMWQRNIPGHLTTPQSRDTFSRYHYAESAQYLYPNLIMNRAFLVQVRCGFKTSNMNILRSAMIVLHVNKRAMYCGWQELSVKRYATCERLGCNFWEQM